jgi:putative acetyltransferase
MTLRIERAELLSPAVQTLIGELNAELTERYPEPGATHFHLDPDEVAPGRGVFLVAFLEDEPVGCGAVRLLPGDSAELKRMYVKEASRGRGFGRAILAALEAQARALGATRLVLETGERQREAVRLYESAGFLRIDPFGEYVTSASTSVCMAKAIAEEAGY